MGNTAFCYAAVTVERLYCTWSNNTINLKVGDSMTKKELKKLSRADLLELLIEQSEELNELRARLTIAEESLKNREIAVSRAGSIAEASLILNGVFEAAQAACEQYLDNVRMHSDQLVQERSDSFSSMPTVRREGRRYRSRRYEE